ncbi:hypothetical protein FTUN_3318 [Frigoriglobus tundricola]|uniref:Uncharacterized protein n=1 Tax=Frigoriglobus tundricola TaxID=2774151 RepID=A0A6M5YQJ2_9BACT|nr:hypothetical protein FTUN_3318 [Frigoriglobus tundricola]
MNFTVNIANNPALLTSVSMIGAAVTAVQNGVPTTTAVGVTKFISADFTNVKSANAYQISINIYDSKTNSLGTYKVIVPANATPADVVSLINAAVTVHRRLALRFSGLFA